MRHNERADGMGQLRDVTADLVRTVSGETGGALASVETAKTRAALRKALAAGRERPREPPARLVRSIGIALPGGGAPALLETWVLAGGSSDQPGQCDVPLAVLRPSASASGAGSGRRNGQAARPCVLLLHTTNQPKEMFLDPRQCAVTMGHYIDAGFVAAAIDLRYLGARGGQMQYTRAMKAAWRRSQQPGEGSAGGGGAGTATAAATATVTVTPARGRTTGAGTGKGQAKGHASAGCYLMDSAWDVSRAIDFLLGGGAMLGVVDGSRGIGVVGVSLGGSVALLAAAADERVACCAPLIGTQSLAYALKKKAFHARLDSFKGARKDVEGLAVAGEDDSLTAFDEAALSMRGNASKKDAAVVRSVLDAVAPGLLEHFDADRVLPAIAPRPLRILNGERDPRCWLMGLAPAVAAAAPLYASAGAADKFAVLAEVGVGHEHTRAMHASAMELCRQTLLHTQQQ